MKEMRIILRRLAGGWSPRAAVRSASVSEKLIITSAAAYSTLILADDMNRPFFNSAAVTGSAASFQFVNQFRSFSSPTSSDPSNVISIESKEQFNESLHKVQDESLPAIFYFTAAWCGPCRLLSPVIGQLSEKYPHVTTYKIDIDKEELRNELSKLNIHSVPTLHFFQNGKKASEVIGADIQRLKDTMEALYR